MGKYILAWFPMLLIAILNGSLRESWYGKHISELAAHQTSTLTGVALFGLYTWWVVRTWPPQSAQQAMMIGIVWLGLTIAFEFLFGHYVAGHAWRRLFHDYNLFAGRVWVVVLIWMTVAPYVFFRITNR